MSNIIAIPLNKLTRSARNVRKSGGDSIDDLATSILLRGLIHNLTVVEQQADRGENSGKYEVVAGGRRFAALQRLAKQKKVPKTFAVPCHVVDPATATETSLAENIIRVAMHPADQFIAFHDLVVESGLSIDDVAARFGVSPLFVRQLQGTDAVGVPRPTGSKGRAGHRFHQAADACGREDLAAVLQHPELCAAILPDSLF